MGHFYFIRGKVGEIGAVFFYCFSCGVSIIICMKFFIQKGDFSHMAQKIRGFWFRLCGFFVGVFGTLFGSVHNARADVIAPSDCYSSITGQQIASVRSNLGCVGVNDGSSSQCRKLISESEYNTIISRGNKNIDTYYDSIYYSIGGTECDTGTSYEQDGVQYYKCEGNRQWCAEANDNKSRNGTDVDRYLDNYGYTYTAMFRIIGCTNGGSLTGASAGDTVASLSGVSCPAPESSFDDGKTCATKAVEVDVCDTSNKDNLQCRTNILDYFPTFPNGFDGYDNACPGEGTTCYDRGGHNDTDGVKTINGAAYCCVRDFGGDEGNYVGGSTKAALTDAIFGKLDDKCDATETYDGDGLRYVKCKRREWCTEVNYTTTDSKGDLVLDNYGYTYTTMFRIIGCRNTGQHLVGANSGDMVASLDGVTCELCPEVENDDNALMDKMGYSYGRGMCYISYDDTQEHNLYDATGHFQYVNPSSAGDSAKCHCYYNDSVVCSS